MNSPICTTRSERRAAAGLLLAASLLAACGGSRPDAERAIDPALPMARPAEPDKGQGNLSFHYSNKSTDANLAIDLSSTDVYLEMSGKAAREQAEQTQARAPERKAEPAARKAPPPPAAEAKAAPGEGEDAPAEADAGRGTAADLPQPGKGLHKAPPRKPEPPPDEEPADYEDVTAKVLAGIRRAQELFYQKRYPEAMQAARSSLDARPTAEGYALLGSIHFMQGQTGMARRQWLEALRLNPDMPSVVNMLEKTRTPGGRGSPSPRPVYRPPARPAEPDAPYPEEYSPPAPEPARRPADRAAPPPAAPAEAAPDEAGDEPDEAAETPSAPSPEPAASKAAPPPAAEAPKAAAPAAVKAEAPKPPKPGPAPDASQPAAKPAAEAAKAAAPPAAKPEASEPSKPAPADKAAQGGKK